MPAPAAAAETRPTRSPSRARARARAKLLADADTRDPWLASLSLLPVDDGEAAAAAAAASTGWAIGVDPDTGGAIAVLSPDGSSQVWLGFFAPMELAHSVCTTCVLEQRRSCLAGV